MELALQVRSHVLPSAGVRQEVLTNGKKELIPPIAEAGANAIDRFSRRFAESVEKMLKRAGSGTNPALDRL